MTRFTLRRKPDAFPLPRPPVPPGPPPPPPYSELLGVYYGIPSEQQISRWRYRTAFHNRGRERTVDRPREETLAFQRMVFENETLVEYMIGITHSNSSQHLNTLHDVGFGYCFLAALLAGCNQDSMDQRCWALRETLNGLERYRFPGGEVTAEGRQYLMDLRDWGIVGSRP